MPVQTQGTETSQYLEEEKAKATPSVAASESGIDQTVGLPRRGCRTATWTRITNRTARNRRPQRVKAPYVTVVEA
jgi:hypothetical protein